MVYAGFFGWEENHIGSNCCSSSVNLHLLPSSSSSSSSSFSSSFSYASFLLLILIHSFILNDYIAPWLFRKPRSLLVPILSALLPCKAKHFLLWVKWFWMPSREHRLISRSSINTFAFSTLLSRGWSLEFLSGCPRRCVFALSISSSPTLTATLSPLGILEIGPELLLIPLWKTPRWFVATLVNKLVPWCA